MSNKGVKILKFNWKTNDMFRELMILWGEKKLRACTKYKGFLYLQLSEYAKISGLIVVTAKKLM